MSSPFTSLVQAVAFVQAAVAMPTNEIAAVVARDYPEVVPGPGLPSLASLNLTSAELYEMVPTSESHPFLQATTHRVKGSQKSSKTYLLTKFSQRSRWEHQRSPLQLGVWAQRQCLCYCQQPTRLLQLPKLSWNDWLRCP